jgi:hypothetical protein
MLWAMSGVTAAAGWSSDDVTDPRNLRDALLAGLSPAGGRRAAPRQLPLGGVTP